MLNKIKVNIKNNYIELLFVSIVFIIASFLRFNNLSELTTFNADQEWLAYRAKDILQKDIVLIGPVTSVGNYSIGPIFVYMWAFFSFISNNAPIAGALLSVTIGLFSLLMIYFFIRYYIDKKVAIIVMFLLAISAPTIFWDQSPWTPSLFIVAQILLLLGGYLSINNKLGYLIISLSLVIGFQSHVGIVLSLISLCVFFLFVKPIKPDYVTILKSSVIMFIGFLPNIVFDLTHNFVNFYRIFDVLKGENLDYFVGIGKIINVLSYNSVSILYPLKESTFDVILLRILFALVLVNAFRNLRNYRFKKLSWLLITTGLIPALFFYMQQGKFSEYYLMMTVPSLIFMTSLFIYDFLNIKKSEKTIFGLKLILILAISIYLNFNLLNNRRVDFNLKAKQDVVKEIVKMAGTNNYGISLTTKYGDQFGFKYILDYYGITASMPPEKGETRIFSIILPEGFDGMYGMKDFDGIGLRWSGI